MTLQFSEIGDIFRHLRSNKNSGDTFVVVGKPKYNPRHGSPTRICIDLRTKRPVSKSCRLEIVKTGEHKDKQTWIANANAQKNT